MASRAGFLDKQLFPGDDGIDIFSGGSRKPGRIIVRIHDGDPAPHDGVVRAAILRTKKVVAPRLRGTEPHGVVMTGDDVHLYAERRNEKVEDDILTGEDK